MSADSQYTQLALAAAGPYRRAGRFAHGFAKGKLTGDPIFRYVLQNGLLSDARTVLDLGCGQGVLTALIRSAQRAATQGQWPGDWASAPAAERVIGVELMPRDVERGRLALADTGEFILGNIASTRFPEADAVVIFDVLHYLPYDSQDQILRSIGKRLNGQGVLLLRIGDASAGLGFQVSQWTDRVVTWCRGHRMPPTFCRELSQWQVLLRTLGFDVQTEAMSQGTLFSNVLLIARPGGQSAQPTGADE